MKKHAVTVTSRPFPAKFDSKASWSGEWVSKNQKVRRWEIDGEESYEPVGLNDVLNKLEDGRAGRVKDADHALSLLREFGKNVFFVTKVRRKDLKTARAKVNENGNILKFGSSTEWSESQFKNYIGRHADFFYLHDSVETRYDHEIVEDYIRNLKKDRRRGDEFILKAVKHKVTKENLDVSDSFVHNKV